MMAHDCPNCGDRCGCVDLPCSHVCQERADEFDEWNVDDSCPAPGATAPSAALTFTQGPGAGLPVDFARRVIWASLLRFATNKTGMGELAKSIDSFADAVREESRAQLEASREDVRRLLAVQGVRP